MNSRLQFLLVRDKTLFFVEMHTESFVVELTDTQEIVLQTFNTRYIVDDNISSLQIAISISLTFVVISKGNDWANFINHV